MDFAFLIRKFKERILSLTSQLKEALNMLDDADAKIEGLEKRVNQLENLINEKAKKVVKKNSRNSNLPPSKDIYKPKRNQSLRKKSDKKSGGQPGHKGHFLEMSKAPNKIIPITSKVCQDCGSYLNSDKKKLIESRQEIELPPTQSIVYQYDSYGIRCNCGCLNTGNFPDRLKTKVQYGPRVRAMINYMSNYQYVPYKRLQELFEDVFSLHFSQGTILNTLKRTAGKSQGIYASLRNLIEQSEVVGGDETGVKVNGELYYNWVWQNQKITFIACEASRKKENIYKHFKHGFPNAILISDRYAAHLSTPSKGYQICWAHLMRHLNYLTESEDNPWLHRLIDIYRTAKKLKKEKPEWDRSHPKIVKLENQLNQLLMETVDKKLFKETKILYNSLNINRNGILTFLYHKDVSSHNNASERAIRNAKVKMKISGQFKSGQNYFAIMRSIIDTLRKNNKPILESLLKIEKGIDLSFGF